MSKDIIARSNAFGNGDSPAIVVGDQLIRCPGSWGRIVINQSDTVDLIEFQYSLVYGGTFPIAIGKVVNDWAVMANRPWGPQKLDNSSSLDRGSCLAWSSTKMTDNIWEGIVVWVDETVTQVFRDRPTDNLW